METPEPIEFIKNQPFNDSQPGTLLKDFASLLDFIGSNGIAVSEKNQFFAMKLLPEINQRLAKPLAVTLKRPLQKSFPHINALYLLLRASGLSKIQQEKKALKLVLDSDMYADWLTLNPTERYFSLLDAWWRHGSGDIIDDWETDAWHYGNYFGSSLDFFLETLVPSAQKGKPFNPDWLQYQPGAATLALMELFGFISVELGETLKTATWPIARIKPSPWGLALLSVLPRLDPKFEHQRALLLTDTVREDDPVPAWDFALRPHLCAWQNSLKECVAETRTGVHIINISLGPASCKMAVPADTRLNEFAYALLRAFKFDRDHLYDFVFKNRYGITERIAHPNMDSDHEWTCADCTVGELPLYAGMTLQFRYDFGADWRFELKVEAVASQEHACSKPKIIAQNGKPPKQYTW